jgi:hypothetical protein
MIRQRENGENRIILAIEAVAHVESIMDDEFDSDFDGDGVRELVAELRSRLA